MPILVERDLVLYESNIINEYIDERFPHPQLMPADPVMRARAACSSTTSRKNCSCTCSTLEDRTAKPDEKRTDRARQNIRDRLAQLAPHAAEEQVHAGRRILHAGRGGGPAAVAPGPLRHRIAARTPPRMQNTPSAFSRGRAYIEALTPSEKVMRRQDGIHGRIIDQTVSDPCPARVVYG